MINDQFHTHLAFIFRLSEVCYSHFSEKKHMEMEFHSKSNRQSKYFENWIEKMQPCVSGLKFIADIFTRKVGKCENLPRYGWLWSSTLYKFVKLFKKFTKNLFLSSVSVSFHYSLQFPTALFQIFTVHRTYGQG